MLSKNHFVQHKIVFLKMSLENFKTARCEIYQAVFEFFAVFPVFLCDCKRKKAYVTEPICFQCINSCYESGTLSKKDFRLVFLKGGFANLENSFFRRTLNSNFSGSRILDTFHKPIW